MPQPACDRSSAMLVRRSPLALLPALALMLAACGGTALAPASPASPALSLQLEGATLTGLSTVLPVYGYLLEANPRIKPPQDVKSQKLGVGSLGDWGDLERRVGRRKIRLDPEKDVSILSIGGQPV